MSSLHCGNGSLVIQLELPEHYQDCNNNGFNDSCDIDNDDVVSAPDLAMLLSNWNAPS